MYLSKLLLNPRNERALTDLAVPYELHRTLGRAFPHARTNHYRSECGVLFRVETSPSLPILLVQSATEPNWDELPADYALRADGPKPIRLDLRQGQSLRFRLAANPTRRWKEGRGRPGARYPLVRDANPQGIGYLEWLLRQSQQHGFELPVSKTPDGNPLPQVQGIPFHVAPRRRNALSADRRDYDKRELPLFGVRFDGVLTVTDPVRLHEAVRYGIGPAKAFGFGLLSLAPGP
jgi:CRISPR system Cascade subunit CasE